MTNSVMHNKRSDIYLKSQIKCMHNMIFKSVANTLNRVANSLQNIINRFVNKIECK